MVEVEMDSYHNAQKISPTDSYYQDTFQVQWNPYIVDTIGELHVGRYRGLAVAEGFYKYYMTEIWT